MTGLVDWPVWMISSAVIFAFGGNALLCTSFYVVQRTSAARLWGGNLAMLVSLLGTPHWPRNSAPSSRVIPRP